MADSTLNPDALSTSTAPAAAAAAAAVKPPKLPRLPPHARIHKRPILHPPIPSPHSRRAGPNVVYVSATTPFMAAVKRVRKTLAVAEKRALASAMTVRGGGGGGKGGAASSGAASAGDAGVDGDADGDGGGGRGPGDTATSAGTAAAKRSGEEVLLKATNRAIEKALRLALFFQERCEGYAVAIRTGTVSVVDDVVEVERKKKNRKGGKRKQKQNQGEEENQGKEEGGGQGDADEEMEGQNDREEEDDDDDDDDDQLPETQVRRMSVVEVAIRLK